MMFSVYFVADPKAIGRSKLIDDDDLLAKPSRAIKSCTPVDDGNFSVTLLVRSVARCKSDSQYAMCMSR